MVGPRVDDLREAARTGFGGHLSGFLGGMAGYLKARLQLAGLEAKDAAINIALILGLLIGSLIIVVFGYFFLCMAAIFLLAELIGGESTWIWLTFGLALLHFGGAVGLIFWAKARLSTPMFTATLDEFRKDQSWMSDGRLS